MRTKGFVSFLLVATIGISIWGCAGQSGQEAKPASTRLGPQTPGPVQTQPVAKPAQDTQGQQAKTSKGFELRVNCGAYEPFKDKLGRMWLADQELDSTTTWGADDGMTVEWAEAEIAGTDIPQIYQYERYSMGSYVFSVPNGTYTVRLHFAENYEGITGPGLRVFSVSIQGQTVLKDLDLYQTCGGPHKALVKEYNGVEVKDGRLVIGFTPNIENPEINGIEIIGQ